MKKSSQNKIKNNNFFYPLSTFILKILCGTYFLSKIRIILKKFYKCVDKIDKK